MGEPVPMPRFNPQTDRVELVLVDPATDAVVGGFDGRTLDQPPPRAVREPALTAEQATEEDSWDPSRPPAA